MTHPDDAGRRLSEALHAQASRGPMPPQNGPRPQRQAPPPAPPRMPNRMPPPAPRPSQTAPPSPQVQEQATGSDRRQIVWALVVTLLVGAILGGGLALLSVLLPGVLPAIG
ncbi:hypothetical protein [Pseudonocardia endophytica]|uniref:Uncharacterized protein n=1 Tax=Pseudonocardia endophytica TaxID=401976 RepID=A0A4V2PJB3_PSEEN|nr:hypothetical protein [Pseudonocardia endophytica]TCK27806.1 hypothetical protein EV378_3685 [Pseudonocardia endophytica]